MSIFLNGIDAKYITMEVGETLTEGKVCYTQSNCTADDAPEDETFLGVTKAIRGNLWEAGMPRHRLVDVPACDQAAGDCSEKTLGKRTTICGRCFAACPYTKAYVNRLRSGGKTSENP